MRFARELVGRTGHSLLDHQELDMARLATPLPRILPVGAQGVCAQCGASDEGTCRSCGLPSATEFCARATCLTVAQPSQLSPLFCDHR